MKKVMKTDKPCKHCGKKQSQSETGITKELLSGSIHGYVAWKETNDENGKETFYCVPHDHDRAWHTQSFPSMEKLGQYIGQNQLKPY